MTQWTSRDSQSDGWTWNSSRRLPTSLPDQVREASFTRQQKPKHLSLVVSASLHNAQHYKCLTHRTLSEQPFTCPSEFCEALGGVFRAVVVPRYTVEIQEGEKSIPIFGKPLLISQGHLGTPIHAFHVLNKLFRDGLMLMQVPLP
jgi:hypothetical protein